MKRLRKFRPNYLLTGALTAVLFCTVTWITAANRVPVIEFGSPLTAFATDTVPTKPSKDSNALRVVADTSKKPLPDSTNKFLPDSIPKQRVDTFSLKISKDSLDAPVKYEAEDSVVVLIKEKKILLYGKTKTD